MTARDDDLRADLRALAGRWEDEAQRACNPLHEGCPDCIGADYADNLRAVLAAHEPATEPEAPSIEDVLAAHEVSEPRGYAFIVCSCGIEFGTNISARAHVAWAIRGAGAR